VPGLIEPALENCTEVSVVVASNCRGHLVAYPPVSMTFDDTTTTPHDAGTPTRALATVVDAAELAVAVLACARIGAAHSVIFGGFSAQAIADRVVDADSQTVITCDGAWRRGNVVPLKGNVDEACEILGGKAPRNVVVLNRVGNDIGWTDGRDRWWDAVCEGQSDECACEEMDSEEFFDDDEEEPDDFDEEFEEFDDYDDEDDAFDLDDDEEEEL